MEFKPIKFTNSQNKEFVAVLRERVNQYFKDHNISTYGNTSMVVKMVFMLLLYFIPYGLSVAGVITNLWILLPLWIVMGFGMAGIGFSVMHDANHGSFSKNERVNRYIGFVINIVGGFALTWQIQHNTLHHSYTNIDGYDEDINPGKLLRFSPHKPRYWAHRFQHIYGWFLYGLMTLSWSTDKDFVQLIRYKRQGHKLSARRSFRRLMVELVGLKVGYFTYMLVIPMLFMPVPWWQILILFFAMHYVCGFLLGIVFQTAHVMETSAYPLPNEGGNVENSWAVHQLATTSDFAPKNRWLSWFIGGLNYQVEHHLFPNICHVHYPKIAPIVKQTALEFNLPYNVQATFIKALWKHGRMLRMLGRYDALPV